MRIWASPAVELQPIVFLSRWQVMETDEGSRYFIGRNMERGSGRASTRITKFDPKKRRGVTGSGRIYELVGDRGVDTAADYLWAVTCAQTGTSSTDVSSDYDQPAITSHRPVAPFVAHLSYEGGLGRLNAKIPATGQSFELGDLEDLAELLFARGVRQGYLSFPHLDRTGNRPEFVDLVRAVEHRLNQLERGLPRDADGDQSTEWSS
ncbi:MAG: hypothetical protein PCALPYG88_7377 [uncultured Paraburkholderia sp.]|uniref:hypothetical protein n=1 Tax=uncultured Paraburkholderia sp. TaxID=1822466 RepID=UPI0025944076|nr:hypothetical protein [uncultured Paraburkholderia sp.]CAH2904455.1 MAG: hypothetical protein PCALPYG08_7380 [uncultured Paraburkholderia sp.]CAH2943768.1 MAG: hypothetical protein PCALPYG88_7377 [uncultured Paraburkholderia sp.]